MTLILLWSALISLCCWCCRGDQGHASHLLLVDTLPPGINSHQGAPLVIRTNYSGTVFVQKSDELKVVVNISAPTLEEAYSVKVDLSNFDSTLLLQVYEKKPSGLAFIGLKWPLIGIAVATFVVMCCSTLYGVYWFKSKRSFYDLAERKSCAGSSQHGLYRSRNSMHLAVQHGDLVMMPDREEADNIHNDDTLKQVPEMPEEEEAEALEMEELKYKTAKKDLNEECGNDVPSMNDRNLMKSRYHSQMKTVHKDMLKHDGIKKKMRKRKTANGTYSTVMEYPDESDNDSGESGKDNSDVDNDDGNLAPQSDAPLTSTTPLSTFCPVDKEHVTFHPNGVPRKDSFELYSPRMESSNPELKTFSKVDDLSTLNPGEFSKVEQVADEGMFDVNDDKSYSPFLVQADVHPVGPASQILKMSPEKLHSLQRGDASEVSYQNINPTSNKTSARKVAFQDEKESPEPKSVDEALEMFEEISRKYELGTRLDPIRESIGEESVDNHSVVSEGAYSHSIYGSSEIFDTNSRPHVYFDINDSDLELPPDNDDLSDCSIPSPLPLSMTKSGKQGIPSSAISWQQNVKPASTTSVSKPIVPNSGTIFSTFGVYSPQPYSSDRTEKPTESMKSLNQTPNHSGKPEMRKVSPPLPPPPEEFRQPSEVDSSFDFPPPPKVFSKSGEYVEFEKNPTQNGPVPETKMMGPKLSGRGYLAGSKYLNLSILSFACILGIIGGVYCKLPANQIKVYITVYAPKPFLVSETVVYMNEAVKGQVLHEENIKVKRYDVTEPILKSFNRHHCLMHRCEQGCDYNTGQCICLHGYRTKPDGKCEDINECMEGGTSCHSAAGCLNRRGSYDCICSGDYYGNGKSCRACAAPCEMGTYEVQPCSVDKQKICRECTKSCPAGEFMLRPCETNRNAVCRACPQPCPAGEFEYKKCVGDSSRQCKSVKHLSRPKSSKNIIIEDVKNVTKQHFHTKFIPSKFPGLITFKFDRGNSLSMEITVKSLQAGLLFVPINSSNGGPFSAVHRSAQTAQFCPNSVPEHYILHYNKLNKITFTVSDDGSLRQCESHTGNKVGNFPGTAGAADTFLYAEPSPMTDLFEIQPEFFHASSIWAERSNRCSNHSHKCEECSRSCARQMSQSNSECSVLGNESDNGFSPRLRVCYSCCSRRECSDICKDYHKRHCQPKKCLHGSWVQLRVQPRWDSSKVNHFYCHITPLRDQHLVTLDYRISYQGRPFHREQLELFSDTKWRQTGKMIHRGKLLMVNVDSKLSSMPDFLEGDLSRGFGLFKVGKYNNHGHPVKSSVVSGESVLIRPINPFGENNSKKSNPASTVMEYSVIATEQDGPYQPNTDMFVVTYGNDTYPYQVTHRNEAPTLEVTLPQDVSVLEHVFPLVAVQHKTLNGNISNNGSHWLVDVMGRSKSCPGLLKVEVSHPDYPTNPLFKFKMAVRCPRKFHLTFEIPTADDRLLEKEMVISFVDNTTKHVLRVLKPAPANSKIELNEHQLPIDNGVSPSMQQVVRGPSLSGPMGVIFSIPYLASVCGAIILLLFLAAFGLALAPDLPGPESANVRLSYILMMIGYVTINFLYSVIVTMTIFSAVLVAFNSDNISFISQYKKQTEARTAVHYLELNSMWHHMLTELERQKSLANSTKVRCEKSIKPVINDIRQLQEDLLAQTEDLVGKQNIKNVLQRHAQEAVLRMSQDLYSFRDNFNRYVQHLLSQLSHDVEMTLNEVENNKWLAGARFLHGAVINIRKHLNNVSSKKFMDWAHLKHDLSRLEVDSSIPLPSVPHFDGIPDPTPGPNGKMRIVRNLEENANVVREIKVHNHWFFPFPESQLYQGEINQAAKQKISTRSDSSIVFYVLFGLMVAVDILLFAHRMAKTISFAKLLLYGYPEYVDYKETTGDEEGDDDVFHEKTEKPSTMCYRICMGIKKFFIQVVQTLFIPKAVVTVVVCLLVYGAIHLSTVVLSKQTFLKLGLQYHMKGYIDLQVEMINGRLVAHAEQINTVELPLYQSWMAAYIERHERALHMHQQQLKTLQYVHNETYCNYLASLGLDINCTMEDTGPQREYHISAAGCQLSPVWPMFYKRTESRDIIDSQLEVLLASARRIVVDTSQIIVVFLSIVVLKELFGSVLWIYIRSFGSGNSEALPKLGYSPIHQIWLCEIENYF